MNVTCPKCKRKFDALPYNRDGDQVFYHCPKCLCDFTVRESTTEINLDRIRRRLLEIAEDAATFAAWLDHLDAGAEQDMLLSRMCDESGSACDSMCNKCYERWLNSHAREEEDKT